MVISTPFPIRQHRQTEDEWEESILMGGGGWVDG